MSYLDTLPPEVGALITNEVSTLALRNIVDKVNVLCLTRGWRNYSEGTGNECLFGKKVEEMTTMSRLMEHQTTQLRHIVQSDTYRRYTTSKERMERMETSSSKEWDCDAFTAYDEDSELVLIFEDDLLSTVFPLCSEFHGDGRHEIKRILFEMLNNVSL